MTDIPCIEIFWKGKTLHVQSKEHKMDGIKVTVEEKKAEQESKYPCYKIVDGTENDQAIVLFTEPQKGTVIVGSKINGFGQKCDMWDEEQFVPFHGTITIEVE